MTVHSQARKHHWISQCYLKGFTHGGTVDDQLYVIDAAQRKTFTTCPRNVAAERDFNRIDIEGLDPNLIESDLASFESELAEALAGVIKHGQFQSEEHFHIVLEFAALLATRSPERREQVRQWAEQIAKLMIGHSLATEERYESHYGEALRATAPEHQDAISYEGMRAFVERDAYSIHLSRNSHIDLELNATETLLPYFTGRKWTLLVAPEIGGGFVTTDRPVALIWSEQKDRGFLRSPGFGLLGTEIWFPLSSRYALVGIFDGDTGISELAEDKIAIFNGLMIMHSGGRVYAKDEQFQYLNPLGELKRGIDMLADIARFRDNCHE